ncbi:MAG: hypothetical protein LW627_09345 [Ilumatobacteraceae bacterium]|jgi:hypothetical protein|nr:hypothetical protein [Ilumatobacteraceae bacterium]
MDFSKFKTSDWLKVGGAIGFLIFGFFNWLSIDYGGDFGVATETGAKVFDFFVTGTIPWILVLGTGIITVLTATGNMKSGKANLPMLMLLANAVAAVLILIRIIFNPLDGKDALEALGVDVGRGIGMILSTIAVLVATAGAFIGYTESGGNINDLKDINKLKGGFGQG